MTVGSDPYHGDPLGRAFSAQGKLAGVQEQLREARQVIDRQVREIRLLRDLLEAIAPLGELRMLEVVEAEEREEGSQVEA